MLAVYPSLPLVIYPIIYDRERKTNPSRSIRGRVYQEFVSPVEKVKFNMLMENLNVVDYIENERNNYHYPGFLC